MSRIAVIFEGRLHEQMGVFNAVINRVKHLRAVATGCEVDAHLIVGYDRGLNRWLHRTPKMADRPERVVVDGVELHVHWFCHSLADTLRHKLLHRPANDYDRWLSRLAEMLGGYDLLSAHDRIAGTAVSLASHRHGRPHFISWHGASIYTDPPRDAVYRRITADLLEHAECNFFVSNGLEQFARQHITPDFHAQVLYNGATEAFRRLPEADRLRARHERGLRAGVPVVGFVGRMESVKNVLLLPELYRAIGQRYGQELQYVAVGDGALRRQVSQQMDGLGLHCLMPGYVRHAEMPQWMNCIDLLVLPSLLEGFGLVAIEALQCGANVVGSAAQGIPEVIGHDNAFALDDRLVDHMSRRAAQMLRGQVAQPLPQAMRWAVTARREWSIYQQHLVTS